MSDSDRAQAISSLRELASSIRASEELLERASPVIPSMPRMEIKIKLGDVAARLRYVVAQTDKFAASSATA